MKLHFHLFSQEILCELYLRYGSSANDPFNPTGEAFKDTNHGKIINVNDGKYSTIH